MNRQEFAQLAAGHALHALSAADEARYQSALVAHPEWNPTETEDADTAARLASGARPVEPPAWIRDSLLAQIATTAQLPEAPEGQEPDAAVDADPDAAATAAVLVPPARPKRLRILFTLAACLALIAGVGYGAAALNGQLNTPASVVALDEIQAAADAEVASVPLDDGGTATLHWSTELGAAVLVADGLDKLDADQTYQLWLVRGETPLPAGVFDPDSGETIAELEGEMHAGDIVAVTVEQAGGSSTGLPTSDPIFAIPTA